MNIKIMFLFKFISLLLILLTPQTSKSTLNVIYPDREGINESETYPFSLLKMVLIRSKKKFVLTPSELPMTDARIRKELSSGKISIAWFGTSIEYEKKFLPIYFPITLGILGHRLLIINKKNQPIFSSIQTINQLSKYLAIQGIGWSDIFILKEAGLQVVTNTVNQIFSLVNDRPQKVFYFPLGINEIYPILKTKNNNFPKLTVEKKLMIVYPFDFFFFVNKKTKSLHDLVYDELLKAYQNKSMIELFNNHPEHSDFIKKEKFKYRHKIYIENPNMSEKTSKLIKKYNYFKSI